MNIWETIIKDSEIMGVGPLMKEFSANQIQRQLNNSIRLYFMVHMTQQSVRIESNWLALGFASDPTEEEQLARTELAELKLKYETTKNQISELLK